MKKHRLGVTKRRDLKGLLFISPWIVGFLVFFIYPLSQSVIYSFSKVAITAKGRKITPVRFDNFVEIFTKDIYFVERLRSFFMETLFSLPVILVFSLLIAMLINQKIRFKGVFRTLFFLPIIVVSGPVLKMLISAGQASVPLIEQYGIHQIISEALPKFLAEPVSRLFEQLILILWYSGVPILIFMTGLQKIDRALYEASLIDGASSWVSFWKITLPFLKNIVLVNSIYILVFLATSEVNEVLDLIRSNMTNAKKGFGIASAMAWSYAIVVIFMIGICYLLMGHEKKERRRRH